MPFLQANYKRIHYANFPPLDSGTPRETFVFIHGLGSSQNFYLAVIQSLRQDCRCVALDTTGAGRSPYTGIEQSVHTLAADIVDSMDSLQINKAVVVGHSMGGFTVPHLAATWPDRVSAVVLLGPVYPQKEVAPTFEKRIEAVEREGMQAMADTIPQAAVGSRAKPLHRAFIRELLMAQDPDGYKSLCRVVANAWENPPDYRKVGCPTFIIAGEEDKSASLQGCQKILESIGAEEKRMVVQKGIGHWMAIEAPDEVGREIHEFFRQVQ